MEKQPILTVKGLTKRIRNRTLVRNLSFEVYPNEVFGFLGANGAGKTTTIRMIVGLIRPTEGEVQIGGASVQNDFESAMSHVGCIVENPELYSFLTGLENLEQFSRMLGGISRKRLWDVIEQVDLSHAISDKVSTYSLGMRQRLGIAQALLGNPKLLILDEPTNGLDPAGIRELREFIKRLSMEQGLAVFVSSHLLSEVQAMCDRVAIINQGELVAVAKVDELLQSSGQDLLRLRVTPLNQAQVILKQIPNVEVASIDSERIWIRAKEEHVPSMVQTLVENGIQIHAIERQTATLEDLFLSLTGGSEA